jgi:hypothetical protein
MRFEPSASGLVAILRFSGGKDAPILRKIKQPLTASHRPLGGYTEYM